MQGLKDLEMVLEDRESNLFRNKKVPREPLKYDSVIKSTLLRAERKRDHFEEDILKAILEKEDEDGRPLELITPTLKGYMQDLKELQGK